MPVSDIVGRVATGTQLTLGACPRDILVAHYRELWRTSRTAGSRTASEYHQAMRMVALAKPSFFMDLAAAAGASLASVVELFKDSRMVRFFSKVGWSLKNLWSLLKDGYRTFKKLLDAVADYVASTKVMRWTKDELAKLDEFLSRHPKTRALTGVVVGALLLYLWFVMADTGDADWDFDMSDIVAALGGSYALADIFGGREGAKLLMALAVGGLTGLSFPWPAANSVGFAVAAVRTLAKKVRARLKPAKETVEDEAAALGMA